jgi:RimJ/RimL family protein N-acetyltransferase
MEVKENFRRKGLGSFIIQELKKACYLAGRVPAARCNIRNKASRATLLKAGLKVCGFMLKGDIKAE